jgi:ABC-type nitrate/sulfonate/bicarbonate transport system substrate-binding protein
MIYGIQEDGMEGSFQALIRIAKTAFFSVLVVAVISVALSCSRGDGPVQPETVRVGTLELETSTLIFIAEDQQFFKRNGLNINSRYYDTGLGTLKGVLNGEADIAVPVGEYAMVGKIFDDAEIMAIGAIDKVEYQTIVARKDRGIQDTSNFKGKKLGVIRGTQQEFYLARFLQLNGIKIDDVTLVNVTLAHSVDAILDGEVDGVMLVPPHTDTVQERLGSNAVFWPAQAGQLTHQLMICRKEWTTEHPNLVERFLKSLADAQGYLLRHPDKAKNILRERLKLTDKEVANIWSRNQFGLSLDQSLVAAMEDQARWMIGNNLTNEKRIPDFLNYIHEDALRAIKPESVTMIR